MNRPIKFRAWDTINHRMIDWNELMKNKYLLWEFFGNTHYLKGSEEQIYIYRRMQYTGLNDCNGNEIYEGDIVKLFHGTKHERIDTVIWGKYQAGFATGMAPSGSLFGDNQIEVVGNIYETPELIERGGIWL